MEYIKTIRKIKNHKLIIDIPDDFTSEDVEVIVLPLEHDIDNTQNIMKISEESFKEWDNDSDDFYNTL